MNASRYREAKPVTTKPAQCMDCGEWSSECVDGVVCTYCNQKGKGDAGSGETGSD